MTKKRHPLPRRITKAAASIVLVLVAMSTAQADTFNFLYSGSGATASGSFTTTDTASGTLSGAFMSGYANLTSVTITVAGATSGNGTFNKGEFGNIVFVAGGPLNFSTNLVGQANFLALNFFLVNTHGPQAGVGLTELVADAGTREHMFLTLLLRQPTSSFATLASATNGGAAAVLDRLTGSTGSMGAAVAALAAMPVAQQAAVLEKLAPTPAAGTLAATQLSMTSALNQVAGRLGGLRLAEGSFSSPAFAAGGAIGTGLAAGDQKAKSGFWSKVYGVESRQEQKDGFAGYRGTGWGVAFGADREFSAGQVGGVALTYSDTSLGYRDQLSGNSSGVKSTQLSFYGTQDMGAYYVDGMVAYGQQRYNGHRDTGITGVAHSSYGGDQWGLRIGAGYPLALSATTLITPQARLDWTSVKQRAYTESSGGAFALSVAGIAAERLRSSLGVQFDHDTHWGEVKAQPFGRVFWNHDFKSNGIDTTANFVGGGSTFVTPGQTLNRDTYSVGAGVNFFTRDNFSASIAYDVTLGSGYQAQSAQATARWVF